MFFLFQFVYDFWQPLLYTAVIASPFLFGSLYFSDPAPADAHVPALADAIASRKPSGIVYYNCDNWTISVLTDAAAAAAPDAERVLVRRVYGTGTDNDTTFEDTIDVLADYLNARRKEYGRVYMVSFGDHQEGALCSLLGTKLLLNSEPDLDVDDDEYSGFQFIDLANMTVRLSTDSLDDVVHIPSAWDIVCRDYDVKPDIPVVQQYKHVLDSILAELGCDDLDALIDCANLPKDDASVESYDATTADDRTRHAHVE